MNDSAGRLGQLFLRYASPLAGLRRWPVVGACVRWAAARLVPRDALVWMQIQAGPAKDLWLRLNPRTGSDYFRGAVEPQVQEVLSKYLHAGMTFYDIGANIGFFSLLAARIVGPSGRVVAFEADPEIAGRLRENLARNGMSWAFAEQKAVWYERRMVTFARNDLAQSPDRGLGHVDPEATAEDTIQVDAVTLDGYAQTSSAPDFLKCDVEGAEKEVFRGARRLLEEKRPGILCEMHSAENLNTLVREFELFGYACRQISQNHLLALPR